MHRVVIDRDGKINIKWNSNYSFGFGFLELVVLLFIVYAHLLKLFVGQVTHSDCWIYEDEEGQTREDVAHWFVDDTAGHFVTE